MYTINFYSFSTTSGGTTSTTSLSCWGTSTGIVGTGAGAASGTGERAGGWCSAGARVQEGLVVGAGLCGGGGMTGVDVYWLGHDGYRRSSRWRRGYTNRRTCWWERGGKELEIEK